MQVCRYGRSPGHKEPNVLRQAGTGAVQAKQQGLRAEVGMQVQG